MCVSKLTFYIVLLTVKNLFCKPDRFTSQFPPPPEPFPHITYLVRFKQSHKKFIPNLINAQTTGAHQPLKGHHPKFNKTEWKSYTHVVKMLLERVETIVWFFSVPETV